MKTFLFALVLFAQTVFITSAQTNNAILFTENGDRFKVVVNGVLQNSKTETNVKITGLKANFYKCRILFAEKSLGFIDFNMNFAEMGTEITWNIKKNKKGEYVLRAVSSVPLESAAPAAPSQTVVVYSLTPPPETTTTTTTYQQTTTTNNNGNPGDNVNINIGINPNTGGSNMNINSSGQSSSSQTVRSTTTTTTTTSQNGGHEKSGHHESYEKEHHEQSYVPGYTGPVGCARPTGEGEFSSMKESIKSKSFESTRLEYAKYAYGYTYDIGNYYKVNDAFQFESSIDDLNKYISGKKK